MLFSSVVQVKSELGIIPSQGEQVDNSSDLVESIIMTKEESLQGSHRKETKRENWNKKTTKEDTTSSYRLQDSSIGCYSYEKN